METIRVNWTDDRLDHLSQRMDERFDRVDERFNRIEIDIRELNMRFDGMQRTLMQIGGGVIVALFGLIATQV